MVAWAFADGADVIGDRLGLFCLASVLIFAGIRAPVLASPKPEAQASGELRLGLDPTVGLPYARRKGERLEGFEVDIADALGQASALRIKIVETPWQNLLDGVRQGHFDAAMGSLEVSEQPGIRFLTPYYVASQSVLVSGRDNRIHRLADLKDAHVSSTRGTTAALVIAGLNPKPAHVKLSPDLVAPFRALVTGKTQAVVLESALVLHEARRLGPRVRIAGKPILPRPCAVAIAASSPSLEARLNTAFQKMLTTGVIKRVLKTHGVWDSVQVAADLPSSRPLAKIPKKKRSKQNAKLSDKERRP